MSYRKFLDEIEKKLPSPAYLLPASDPFLHTEAESLIKELVPAGEREFNFHVFDLMSADTIAFEQILDVLNTMPFFSGRKYVVVENFQKLLKKELKKLGRYLEKPSESSVLVLLNSGAVKKEVREGIGNLKSIPLDISGREITSWLREKAGQKGVRLTDSAADYLLGTIGPDLGLLSSELDKFALIGKPTADREDIAEITEGKRTYSAFALVDAIRARDAESAFKIYRVLRDTEEPYGLIGALNWQYAKNFTGSNAPEDKKYYYKVFSELNRADLDIKSSGGPYPMEFLLVKLLRLSKGR
jgi:DNA polymerase III delta subunit